MAIGDELSFFFGCLASTWIGRKIGWGLSRRLLYTSNWAVCIVLCLAWATGVAYALRLFILAMQPGLPLKLFGYGAGAYISIPNYGLLNESTVPEYGRPRHDFIKGVPSLVYIVTSVVFAFTVFASSPNSTADQLAPTGQITGQESSEDDEYSSLASKINDLEIRELIARGNNANVDITDIDKQLAPLRARLAQLRPRHDQEVEARRHQQEAEAQRQKQEQIERESAELQKGCEAVRSKRLVDLIVNDVELLKQCGTAVPHLPLQ